MAAAAAAVHSKGSNRAAAARGSRADLVGCPPGLDSRKRAEAARRVVARAPDLALAARVVAPAREQEGGLGPAELGWVVAALARSGAARAQAVAVLQERHRGPGDQKVEFAL